MLPTAIRISCADLYVPSLHQSGRSSAVAAGIALAIMRLCPDLDILAGSAIDEYFGEDHAEFLLRKATCLGCPLRAN